jgi:ubiquinone/menaquinone biosynthesis C-methylase UbiE
MMPLQPHGTRPAIANREDVVELTRLTNKSRLVSRAVGGMFPGVAQADLLQIHDVLELGCGPGAWTLDVGRAYPGMQVIGIDSSHLMVTYAQSCAETLRLHNVRHLHVPSLAGPFEFPDASFDLICSQFLSKCLFKGDWPGLLAECRRLLRPWGSLCLTEFEVGLSNAPFHEEFISLFLQAMNRAGRSFCPTGRHLGRWCELEALLVATGFEHSTCQVHAINYSYGAPDREEWTNDYLILSKQVQPLILQMQLATPEHLERLAQQQQRELHLPGFHGVLPLFWVRGTKPQ